MSYNALDVIESFRSAWGRGEVDELMSLMTDTPMYKSSTGIGPGSVFVGVDEVRSAFIRMTGNTKIAVDILANRSVQVPLIEGNRAVIFWVLPFSSPDGTATGVEGLDVFTFESDGRISCKDAFRKAWI